MQGAHGSRARRAHGGFALLSVLLVLLALLVLCAPFLMTARNASKASTQLADRAQARLALDSAARNARAALGNSHPALDATPYFDDIEELAVSTDFPPGFVDPHDAHGVMWNSLVRDVAGSIDLNSAPPQVFANVLGATTRLTQAIKATDKEIEVSTTWGFPPAGFLWVDRELIGYTKIDGQKFAGLQRGLGGKTDDKGDPVECGPQLPSDHVAGTVVIDQRAFAPILWRTMTPDGKLRNFDAPEQLRDSVQLALGIDARKFEDVDGFVDPISRVVSSYGGVRAGREWQRPVRLRNSIRGGIDCLLDVDERRWFNRGATVMVTDGASTELAIVASVEDRGFRVFEPLHYSYDAFRAEVRVLARRPVNANTAPREVLEILFTNLQVRGKNDRITHDEAQTLAQLVVDSRPFTGFEDFVRRIVLPAAALEKLPSDAPVKPPILAQGGAIIDAYDAVALYANTLDANDSTLEYSTMPLSFTSRDVFDLDLRASVNAPSGVERIAAERDAVEMVVPQRDLLQLWARQEDWDEAMRLDREAPWWSTGPNSTSMWDSGASPPSRLWPHLGTYAGKVFVPGITPLPAGEAPSTPPVATHVFASREEDGYAQLWASRADETGLRAGRVMHFDYETRDPEGRYLPDETVSLATSDKMVGWTDAASTSSTTATPPLLRALNFSMWIKPRALADGTFLDIGRSSLETDRITLGIEGSDLVLRVRDAGGDISNTTAVEAGEARFSVAAGATAPGLLADTWTHVSVDVRGTRPSQITMLVDGRTGRQYGVRNLGLTKLVGQLPQSSATINVESTEGFPDRCVLRIGNELIEAVRSGPAGFDATPSLAGATAGFGGREARVTWQADPTGNYAGTPELSSTQSLVTTHAADTAVELYGYAAVLASNVPAGSASLPAAIGPFAVAIVDQVVVGTQTNFGEDIIVTFPNALGIPIPYPVGKGLEGNGSQVTGLVLKSADNPTQLASISAFNANGGYAALIMKNTGATTVVTGGVGGSPLGGVEIVHYSGYDTATATLHITQRGVAGTGTLTGSNGQPQAVTWGRRAFVAEWQSFWAPLAQQLDWQTFVVPISIPAPGAVGSFGFPDPTAGNAQTTGSEFAQITETAQAELTEWVRYDDIQGDQLIRNDAQALLNDLYFGITNGNGNIPPPPPQPPNGGGGGGLPGSLIAVGASSSSAPEPSAAANPEPSAAAGPEPSAAASPEPSAAAGPEPSAVASAEPNAAASSLASAAPNATPSAAAQGTQPYLWQAYLGVAEDSQLFVTRAAASWLQFRGVLGTYAHSHAAGAVIVPVWRVEQSTAIGTDPDRGVPGRFDTIVLMEDVPGSLGWPATVHRGARPFDHIRYLYLASQTGIDPTTPAAPTAGLVDTIPEEPLILARNAVCVALDRASPAPVPKSLAQPTQNYESRQFARALKHPSGERPRDPDRVVIGATIRNAGIPSATVDEIVFGSTLFGNSGATQGGNLMLTEAFGDGQQTLKLARGTLRIAWGRYSTVNSFLPQLTQDAGLLRIGNEILCYSAIDDSTGTLTIPQGGRGLLGTTEVPHEVGETAEFLDQFTVSVLNAGASADGNAFTLADVSRFPFQGTALAGDELFHYTRIAGSSLEMPRRSSDPGRMDNKGPGIFRGRYGTTPAAHAAGVPVIQFPFRYWDRWADRCDGPELSYFALCVDQPQAFFRTAFWTSEEPSSGQARIEVLQRTTTRGAAPVPWDGDPDTTKGLAKLTQGTKEGKPNTIAEPGDLIEWRAFVRYDVNAFDARTGLSHGWKQTPHLKVFGAEYLGPNLVLRRVDQ